MARTTAPLLSMDASGSVGHSITFAKWKGRNYVRRYAIPSNPRSTGQTSIRAAMQFYASLYKANTAIVDSNFAVAAASAKISPYNMFTSKGMKAWKSSVLLTPEDLEISTITSTANLSLSGTAQPRGITWSWGETVPDDPRGWVLLVREAADPGTTTGYAVFGSATATSYLLTGLKGATAYQARIMMFDDANNAWVRNAAVSVTTP